MPRWTIFGAGDIGCDASEAAARFVWRRRHSCRQHRSRSVARDAICNRAQGFRRGLHHVVAAGAVNVDIDEARNDDGVAGDDVARVGGHLDFIAMADGGDAIILNDDHAIVQFLVRREDAMGMDDLRNHDRTSYSNWRGEKQGRLASWCWFVTI